MTRLAQIERRRHGSEGIALPFALMVTVLVLVTGLALMELARMDAVRASWNVQAAQAQAAAELGLARAKSMAGSQKAPWSVMRYGGAYLYFTSSADPLYAGHQTCTLFSDIPVGGDVPGTYSVVIEDLTGWLPTSGSYRIHGFGTVGNATRHVTLDSQTLTYASFGWLTNNENGVYFGEDDVVDGWVHTNDRLNIWGSPTFKGRVTSAASSIRYAHGGPPSDNPDFQAGVVLNSPQLDIAALMNQGHITAIRTAAQQPGGILLPANSGRPYRVTFNPSGKVTIARQDKKNKWTTVINNQYLSSTNGAIYIEETVWVNGEVDGEVTLATPQGKDILIVDDLYYSSPSKTAMFRSDYDMEAQTSKLALISGGDIVISKDWNNGWGDMYITASMAAVGGSFRNDAYTRTPQKTLHILGGLAQDTRGPVGQVGGAGFTKDYRYDTRFMTAPPPHLPALGYQFSQWSTEP